MVELRRVEDVQDTARRAGLRIVGPVDDARDAGKHDRAGAHGAWLERDVHDRVQHPPAAERAGGFAQRDQLGVGGGIGPDLALVVPRTDDLAVLDDYRSDRDVVVIERTRSLAQSQAHEIFVAGEEVRAQVRPTDRYFYEEGNFRAPDHVFNGAESPSGCGFGDLHPVTRTLNLRPIAAAALACAVLIGVSAWRAAGAEAADYVPREVVVGYDPGPFPAFAADVASRKGAPAVAAGTPAPQTVVLRLPPGVSVTAGLDRLRGRPGVSYAVPNFLAHADGAGWIPNDPGRSHIRGGWEKLQWNFMPGAGVDAPQAWANLRADRRPGGRGVTVAILDTGIAYRNWEQFRRSPDFNRTRFVDPYDFVAHNRYPLDREGHGTFVAGIVAESTNNGIGVTGLAYGASIMPVRVLDRTGSGDAATIADGVRYAVRHHAQVINLSLEFTPDITAGDIPDLIGAIRYAARHHVVVVGAAGNDYDASQVAYPARAPTVISVGATTLDRCLADYSNGGARLDLVAPGGGGDRPLSSDPDCHPGRSLPPIYQMTFSNPDDPAQFGLPGGIYGTSMSTPEVSATAAMIIASRILGPRPTPDQILNRLEQTAQPLGKGRPNIDYGWGLLDAGAATAPLAPAASRRS